MIRSFASSLHYQRLDGTKDFSLVLVSSLFLATHTACCLMSYDQQQQYSVLFLGVDHKTYSHLWSQQFYSWVIYSWVISQMLILQHYSYHQCYNCLGQWSNSSLQQSSICGYSARWLQCQMVISAALIAVVIRQHSLDQISYTTVL